MIRHILWDVDGTVFDTYPAITRAFVAAMAERKINVDPDRVLGLCLESLSLCAKTLASEHALDLDELLHDFGHLYRRTPPSEQPLFPGVREICDYMHSIGGRNWIVTHRRRESLRRLLAAHEMAGYFGDMITADDELPRKPDPASFIEMMRRHDIHPGETLAVGDRELDVLAGQAAGVTIFYFGLIPISATADYAVSDMRELLSILQSLNDTQGGVW